MKAHWTVRMICLAPLVAAACSSETESFPVDESRCYQGHCQGSLGDRNPQPVPERVEILWQDLLPSGSKLGIGCSANSKVVVCSYDDDTDAVVAYNGDGERLWSSGALLGRDSWTSAPLVSTDGEVIAADDSQLIRFDKTGQVRWQQFLGEEGRPISPVLGQDGEILVVRQDGPISTYDVESGEEITTLKLQEAGVDGFFSSLNTPAIANGRYYLVLHRNDAATTGWLVALELERNPNPELKVIWNFEFGGRSGASPVVKEGVIYFDGEQEYPGSGGPSYMFAVADRGDAAELLWKRELPGQVEASFAPDPRGGLWIFALGDSLLRRVDEVSGNELEVIDLRTLMGAEQNVRPSSVMTIAGSDERPIMLVSSLVLFPNRNRLLAIDLAQRSLLWSVELPGFTAAQFPIVDNAEGKKRIVFASSESGAMGLGEL